MEKISLSRGTKAGLGATIVSPVVSSLVLAMQANKAVAFNYDDKLRIVEVHAIGTSTKDGGVIFRGYQIDGEASRPLPQWTLYRLDKLTDLAITTRNSEAPRDGYIEGDKQMSEVFAEIRL